MKRAQIHVFILIGLLVLLTGLVLYRTTPRTDAPDVLLPANAANARDAIQGCIDDSLMQGVLLLTIHGGVIYTYPNIVLLEHPVAVHDSSGPSRNFMSREVGRFVAENSLYCVQKLFPNGSSTDYAGVRVISANLVAAVEILPQEIVATLTFPVQINHAQGSSLQEEWLSRVQEPLGELLDIKDRKLASLQQGTLAFKDVSSSAYQLDMLPVDQSSTIYSIRKQNFTFVFAVRT